MLKTEYQNFKDKQKCFKVSVLKIKKGPKPFLNIIFINRLIFALAGFIICFQGIFYSIDLILRIICRIDYHFISQ